jgi:hypothetical protein
LNYRPRTTLNSLNFIYIIQKFSSYLTGNILILCYEHQLINAVLGKHVMGRACRTNGGDEECIWDIGGKTRRKETTRKTNT